MGKLIYYLFCVLFFLQFYSVSASNEVKTISSVDLSKYSYYPIKGISNDGSIIIRETTFDNGRRPIVVVETPNGSKEYSGHIWYKSPGGIQLYVQNDNNYAFIYGGDRELIKDGKIIDNNISEFGFSPVGNGYFYVKESDDNKGYFVIKDGKNIGYYDSLDVLTNFKYSENGLLFYEGCRKSKCYFVVNGKEIDYGGDIQGPIDNPKEESKKVAIAKNGNYAFIYLKEGKTHLYKNGKEVLDNSPRSTYVDYLKLLYSSDGTSFSYYKESYDYITKKSISGRYKGGKLINTDGYLCEYAKYLSENRLFLKCNKGNKNAIFIDGIKVSNDYNNISNITFSENLRHYAYLIGDKFVIDEKEENLDEKYKISAGPNFRFSSSGNSYIYELNYNDSAHVRLAKVINGKVIPGVLGVQFIGKSDNYLGYMLKIENIGGEEKGKLYKFLGDNMEEINDELPSDNIFTFNDFDNDIYIFKGKLYISGEELKGFSLFPDNLYYSAGGSSWIKPNLIKLKDGKLILYTNFKLQNKNIEETEAGEVYKIILDENSKKNIGNSDKDIIKISNIQNENINTKVTKYIIPADIEKSILINAIKINKLSNSRKKLYITQLKQNLSKEKEGTKNYEIIKSLLLKISK